MPENKSFSFTDTLFSKGVATCLLLMHHLFYEKSYPFSPFLGRSVWVDIAAVGKVCVGIFLILSGFGLTKSFERKHETGFRFAIKHIGKLYAEFLFVFFLSLIPLFFDFNGQNFISVWGREWCKPFVINMSGLQYFWNE